jgi:predicted nucleic acid-binding protein
VTFSSCLTDHDKVIVLDASVIINLMATGYAGKILEAVGSSIVVTGNVVREINHGAENGRREPKLLAELMNSKILQIEELSGQSLDHFFDMVSGHTTDSLGDGEAATLVFAHSNGHTAAIDERKATRIAGERFGGMKLVTTVDILAHAPVRESLGLEELSNATLNALQAARMQVREHQFEWVAKLIGDESLSACASLRKLVRSRTEPRAAQL